MRRTVHVASDHTVVVVVVELLIWSAEHDADAHREVRRERRSVPGVDAVEHVHVAVDLHADVREAEDDHLATMQLRSESGKDSGTE